MVDDHPAMRAGLVAILGDEADLDVVAEASDGQTAIACYASSRPDVMLLDYQLPDMNGDAVVAELLKTNPSAIVLIVSSYGEEEAIRSSLAAGARGYLLKDTRSEDIVDAVRAAARGQRVVKGVIASRLADSMGRETLSSREKDVLAHLARGSSNKIIAYELGIAEPTVKVHVSHILGKLGATDRTDAVLRALKRGLVTLD